MAAARLKTKTAAKPVAANRRVRTAAYRSFRLSKPVKQAKLSVSGSFSLFRQSLSYLWQNRRLYAGIAFVYGVSVLILVRGLGGGVNITELKDSLNDMVGESRSSFNTGLAVFGLLVVSAGSSGGEAAGVYQLLLIIVVSLAIIWALRHSGQNKSPAVKDAYYRGMYPLIPFILVLLVVCLHLLPLLVGVWLYNGIASEGLAVTFAEQAIWAVLAFLLAVLSLYMLTSSILALYVATLPDMTPMRALRSARELVRNYRWTVMRRILSLPLILFIGGGLVMVPLIMLVPPVAEWVFFAASLAVLPIIHTYTYMLYKELL